MDNYADLKRVQELVADLRQPNQIHYFTDLLLCSILGWAAFIYAWFPNPLLWRLLAFTTAVVLLYRSLAFIHEMVHQKNMKFFRYVWHAVLGVPLLIPLLLYLPIHQAHHNKQTYGTLDDGEYEQLKDRWAVASLKMFSINLLIPLALWVRFAILPPVALIVPQVREKVIPKFIHLAIRMPFRAPFLRTNERTEALSIEWFCCAWAWSLILIGVWCHWMWVIAWSVLLILIATLNTIRALSATHLYDEQKHGRDAHGQLLDSLNIDSNGPLALILCPVGLRFHALHHIAPYLPYHTLPQAHQRLLKELPKNSEYEQVTVYSIKEGFIRVQKGSLSLAP